MTLERPRFFWITPKWPLPPEDGARRATVSLLKGLTSQGIDIHLCAIVPAGDEVEAEQARRELGVSRVTLVRRRRSSRLNHLVNLLRRPRVPLTVAPYSTRAVARQVEAALAASSGRLVVFDGLHAAGWLAATKGTVSGPLRKIYRAHNVESNLWVQGARKSTAPLAVMFLRFQAYRMGAFEKRVSRASSLVAAVSRDDELGLQALYGPTRTAHIPIGIPLSAVSASAAFPTARKLLFIGRLDWLPNKEGLAWLLDDVWPKAAAVAPDLSLTIVGAGDGRWLERFANLPRVRILGRVPDIAPLYQAAAAALVPVSFGSGTRVKAIEASAFARPCISTAIGVEGIGLDPASSYFRAETRDEWLAAITNLDLAEAERRGKRAFDLIEREFEPGRVARRFLESCAHLSANQECE